MRLSRLAKDCIGEVPPYIPGKNIEEVASSYGLEPEKVVKLASNENPLGPSPLAKEAVLNASGKFHLYPDPEAGKLSTALKDYLGVESEVAVGNGSDDLLEQMAKIFIGNGDEAMVATPSFSYYPILTRMYGGRVKEVPLEEGVKSFSLNIGRVLSAIGDKTRIIFLCSPNNPTGNLISEGKIEEVLQSNKVVVLDEAYAEFAGRSLVELTEAYSNLVVTRTFSKAFGLAGLRVGYCACSEEIKELILRVKQPFNVSSLAQSAALAALEDREHLERSIALTRKGRVEILREVRPIGLRAYNSHANFVLIRGKKGSNHAERLLQRGIIVRGCSSFPGLNEDYFRVSVGLEEQNRVFLRELKELAKGD